MSRQRYKSFNNSEWNSLMITISYENLRKIQERAFKAGWDLAEFTYRDREFKAPATFEEWFDIESKHIGGYVNDSQELEILDE